MLHTYTTTPKLREWVEENRSGNQRSNGAVNKKEVMTRIWKFVFFFCSCNGWSVATKTSCRGRKDVPVIFLPTVKTANNIIAACVMDGHYCTAIYLWS